MRDFTGSTEQLQAITVRCRACGVAIGVVCVDRKDGNRPLTRFPAHTVRVNDAERVSRGEALPAPGVDAREFSAVAQRVEEARAAAPADWSATDAVDLDREPLRDFSEPSHGRTEPGDR